MRVAAARPLLRDCQTMCIRKLLLLDVRVNAVAGQGATPLLVAEEIRIVGLVVLEDVLKPAIRERFEQLRTRSFTPLSGPAGEPLVNVL